MANSVLYTYTVVALCRPSPKKPGARGQVTKMAAIGGRTFSTAETLKHNNILYATVYSNLYTRPARKDAYRPPWRPHGCHVDEWPTQMMISGLIIRSILLTNKRYIFFSFGY